MEHIIFMEQVPLTLFAACGQGGVVYSDNTKMRGNPNFKQPGQIWLFQRNGQKVASSLSQACNLTGISKNRSGNGKAPFA
jgi:hypothetical protein